jgi:uncharacterized protein
MAGASGQVDGMKPLQLTCLPGEFVVCRLNPEEPLPPVLASAGLVSITRTADELSIVCPRNAAPEGSRQEPGWRCLAIEGPLPFSATGILASVAVPLANAGVSIFAMSTFDTDYLLVRDAQLGEAVLALRAAGHDVEEQR